MDSSADTEVVPEDGLAFLRVARAASRILLIWRVRFGFTGRGPGGVRRDGGSMFWSCLCVVLRAVRALRRSGEVWFVVVVGVICLVEGFMVRGRGVKKSVSMVVVLEIVELQMLEQEFCRCSPSGERCWL